MKYKSLIIVLSLLTHTVIGEVKNEEITVYSARKAHLIEPLFSAFTAETGIKVNYLTGKGADLIERLKLEGKNTKADLFMTVDAGNLWYAGTQNLFQAIQSESLASNIPSYLRDPQGLWSGLSVRARTIVYHPERVNSADLSSYADLASSKYKGRLCLRTSKKIYTKSLVASLLYHHGKDKTSQIISGWVDNLAATPYAKDSQVMHAILAGQCDLGLVNTYYFGRLIEKNPSAEIKLFWANQATTGVHVNVSGAGVVKYAPHPRAAIKLLEWLATAKAQRLYAALNKEYPANQNIDADASVAAWGQFKADKMNLSQAGILQAEAVKLMQIKGYK